MTLREQFKKDHPETIGETDRAFDDYNYIEWLEKYARRQWQNGYDAGFSRAVSIFDESFQILTSKKK